MNYVNTITIEENYQFFKNSLLNIIKVARNSF